MLHGLFIYFDTHLVIFILFVFILFKGGGFYPPQTGYNQVGHVLFYY